MTIIGVCGYAESGKDTVADYLSATYKFVKLCFATKVRQVATLLGDTVIVGADAKGKILTYNDAIDRYGYERAKREFPAIRNYLVNIGDGLRKTLGEKLWIDQVFSKISEEGYENVVIADCRYSNEAEKILESGGFLIWVHRPSIINPSEIEKDNYEKFQSKMKYRIFNDGTIADIYTQIDQIMSDAFGLNKVD